MTASRAATTYEIEFVSRADILVDFPRAQRGIVMFRDAYVREKKGTIFYSEHHRTTPLDHGTGGYHKGREEWCVFCKKLHKNPSFFWILGKTVFLENG